MGETWMIPTELRNQSRVKSVDRGDPPYLYSHRLGTHLDVQMACQGSWFQRRNRRKASTVNAVRK